MNTPGTVAVDAQLLDASADLASAHKHTAYLTESYLAAIRDGHVNEQERRSLELSLAAVKNAVHNFEQKLTRHTTGDADQVS